MSEEETRAAVKDNKLLSAYLDVTVHSEFPALYSVWSVIGCASAALGRHAWFDFGISNIYPNMYVVLSGTPGSRKSEAQKPPVALLREAAKGLRFAPHDTGDRPQGLIEAILQPVDCAEEQTGVEMNELLFDTPIDLLGYPPLKADKHFMFLYNDDIGTNFGTGIVALARFLSKMWDGLEYTGRLKRSQFKVNGGLMAILGATTPDDMHRFMPAESIGQGFPSRIIFVNAKRKGKVAWPKDVKKESGFLREAYEWMFTDCLGAFSLSDEARELVGSLYLTGATAISDTRFVYYKERRHTQLLKLMCICAALEKTMAINATHVRTAHSLLLITETTMPDALGEFGLSPLSKAKHGLLVFIEATDGWIPRKALRQLTCRDIASEAMFSEVLLEFMATGKVIKDNLPDIGEVYRASNKSEKRKDRAAIRAMLKKGNNENVSSLLDL